MSMNQPRVVVVGSINMDLVIRCPELPRPGETVMGLTAVELPGGKGANQAVAASRMGGSVTMIGRVGDDAFGQKLIQQLKLEGVNTDRVIVTPQTASGLAVVSVDNHAENSIVVVPGANAMVSVDDVVAAKSLIEQADILLIQLEVAVETVEAAVEVARNAGTKIVLDPAPSIGRLTSKLIHCDLICPNLSEAESILGRRFADREDAVAAARELVELGCRRAIITLGAEGSLVCEGGDVTHVSGFSVEAVDTTASGDAFAGTLAVTWCQQENLVLAMKRANAAGAIVASRAGAQVAMPTAEEVESLLGDQG